MAVFIELTVDPFIDRFSRVADGTSRTKGAGASRVRRPLRGLEVKDDTYAFIKLIRADGQEIELIDAGAPEGGTTEYSNFILQSVQEQRVERHQIIETFGDTYVFLFGAAPHMLQCSAVLLNSHDFNWKDEFMENYDKYMRGTRSLEYGARTYLFYDQNIVEGYLLNAQISMSSEQPLFAQLQFQFFVTNHQSVAMLGDPWFPVRSSVALPPGVSLVDTWDVDILLDHTIEGYDYCQGEGWARDRPVREKIASPVSDEYTTPMQTTALEVDNSVRNRQIERRLAEIERERLQELEDLDRAINDFLSSAGVEGADEPSVWEKLGLQPHWTENGVSFGNENTPFSGHASYGSHPGNDAIGGYVGKNSSTAMGVGYGPDGFYSYGIPGAAGEAVGGAVDWANEQAQKGSDWVSSKTSSAYAAAQGAAAGAAAEAARAAAAAGGYVNSNEYVSWTSQRSTGPEAGSSSTGGSVSVPGDPVPFAFVSAKGALGSFSWSW